MLMEQGSGRGVVFHIAYDDDTVFIHSTLELKLLLLLFLHECGTRAVGRIVILARDCVNTHRPLPAEPLVCSLDLRYRWAFTAILEHAIIVRFCYRV